LVVYPLNCKFIRGWHGLDWESRKNERDYHASKKPDYDKKEWVKKEGREESLLGLEAPLKGEERITGGGGCESSHSIHRK